MKWRKQFPQNDYSRMNSKNPIWIKSLINLTIRKKRNQPSKMSERRINQTAILIKIKVFKYQSKCISTTEYYYKVLKI